ncbi:transcription initiation factor IIA subunit 2-like [Rosa rugosa]|uniref:transcription initiation factor IIA subunit 2-like n=1 Tax=Rosa rugosa TaxID=74645 RepID=UPI002B411F43|nr:transcription initiation factor IIA subunit 2-like [Rosa rugosa]
MATLYRSSGIGKCLVETLEEMLENGTLTAELAFQVLLQFDASMAQAFRTRVKNKVSIKGHLHTYNFCNHVWNFSVHDAVVRYQNNIGATVEENVDRLKIVACDPKSPADLVISSS